MKAISFTGSTATGARIAGAAAPQFKKVSLEMGGKNPAIVFADADLSDANLDTIVRSGFANQGEICLCGSRLLVQRSIYETFRQRYLARVQALRVGDPNDAASELGAMVSQAHYDKVLGCIAQARAEGGQVLCGGDADPPARTLRRRLVHRAHRDRRACRPRRPPTSRKSSARWSA